MSTITQTKRDWKRIFEQLEESDFDCVGWLVGSRAKAKVAVVNGTDSKFRPKGTWLTRRGRCVYIIRDDVKPRMERRSLVDSLQLASTSAQVLLESGFHFAGYLMPSRLAAMIFERHTTLSPYCARRICITREKKAIWFYKEEHLASLDSLSDSAA